MGIINVTPDSFYAGSRQQHKTGLLKKAGEMLSEGATLLDVGGYSSRPGADHISEEEETKRVSEAIAAIHHQFPEACISVDTFRAGVAEKAVACGACMINDISGGSLDEQMFETVAQLNVPYILMHMKGTPQNMIRQTDYNHLITDIYHYFSEKVGQLNHLGVSDIVLDPGFGFSKTREQSYEVLRNLGYFKSMKLPLLAGISRKSMIYKELGTSPEAALNGTTALNMIALTNGASLLRVHDVKPAIEAVQLFKATYP
ncbi:MAG: dihydropteroate synthase [Roseivirga sp.]